MKYLGLFAFMAFGYGASALNPAIPSKFTCNLFNENGLQTAVLIFDINHERTDHPDDWAASYEVKDSRSGEILISSIIWVEEDGDHKTIYVPEDTTGMYKWFGYENLGEFTDGRFIVNFVTQPASLTFVGYYGGEDLEATLQDCEVESL